MCEHVVLTMGCSQSTMQSQSVTKSVSQLNTEAHIEAQTVMEEGGRMWVGVVVLSLKHASREIGTNGKYY